MRTKQAGTLARRTILGGLVAAAAAFAPLGASAEEVVNVYTTREPALAKPVFDAFTEKTGVKVNTVFVKEGLAERVKAEGAASPADVLMTVDIGNLLDLVDQGVTQNVKSEVLEKAIPANLRGANGEWFAVSMRGRVVYASKDRVKLTAITYEDLAKPEWKGKICIRSGKHPYNTALIAAYIAHHGEAKAEEWLKGLKANLARKPAGGDRENARDILGDICDLGVANSYYVGLMRSGKGGPEQEKWAEAINVILPTFEGGGTNVNVSGASVAKNAPNQANALKLMEFLVSHEAQDVYARANFEYPVVAGSTVDPIIAAFGPLKIDNLDIAKIGQYRKAAADLVDKVGFDN
ncbi:Fe(3+) ABC transporter substrate-binding protein [Ancylobacter defluvii]|uniref:Iron ABC transporter substrate-binding protein n=1 Tax=Ancylobacter defluvii TaxID=1282440 RepID=A0A9W6JYV8_9HYPH|nr:Fe(3+) ABC transporter substrate-binding protein [Ancylobacter defluvii]MBS7589393.1 Fe(3+) ABC transporter substrate-binding protein [Ancylobacter defluvii]GLK85008.1 iron ABC transporter substrate-binding protein [Ancylobacter defluvii]